MNDTRNYGKENTSTYLVQKFIASEKSHEIKLLPIDIVILFIIARYLDMPKGECFAGQKTLGRECRISAEYFGDRCIYLVQQKVIFRFIRGKGFGYNLGELLTGIDPYND